MTLIEKQRQIGDEEVIKELCSANGLSCEKVCQDGSGISSLEVFFSGYPRMVGLSFFPRLSKLVIMGQSVTHIQGLEHCPLLKELWVAECQLKEISRLHNCLQLQKLYLYDNRISEIANLELLVNLEVLWLNSNLITKIEGLETLEKLKELNLAENAIERIGHSLDPNINLQNLNLSGNQISSFKELTPLAALGQLKELGLQDPQSGPNPVCLLYNYATHLLYHLPQLQRLDTHRISSKQIKDTAESTVLKKMMYYSMRVRLVQRQLDETQARLLEQRNGRLQLPWDRIHMLTCTLKTLELELSEMQATGRRSARTWEEVASPATEGSGDPSDTLSELSRDPGQEQRLLGKLDAIRERLRLWNQRMEEVEAQHRREVKLATDRKEMTEHFLVLELETVGNIRFEEGSTSDTWFTSCYDLLLSRFCAWDYSKYDVTGIKVKHIIRVHNRALRLRFENKLHSLLASKDSQLFSQNYKRGLDYLFYVPDPEHAPEENEILHILENGFKTADHYKTLGRERAVPLSNSLSGCEHLRMNAIRRQSTKSAQELHPDPLPFKNGQLIISKVFLGRSVALKEGVPVDPTNYPKAHSIRSVSQNHQSSYKTAPAAEIQCSLKGSCCDCLQRQTQWFVFDHELVLPEYLVHFEYITQEGVQHPSPNDGDLDPAGDPKLTSNDLARDDEVLAMEPILKPRAKLLSLDEKTLLNVARANVLSQITVLNLHGNRLSKLKEISRLTALRHLTISFNELTQLDDISHLPNLENVDASFNHISTLEGLRGLPRLKQLDLAWNQLSYAREETAVLRKHAPALLQLDTRHNPWHKCESIRMLVLGRLRSLTHLDDVLITEEEAAAAVQVAMGSRINQACLLAHARTDAERPRSLSLLSAAQLLTHLKPSPFDPRYDLQPGWTSKITALNLDGQGLTRLSNLDKLVNLRWASFNNNELSRVEGLDNCSLLEELSLDNNCLCKLDGISQLHRLTRLSVSGNQLTALDGSILDRLPNLHFLSAENNALHSLYGIQRARLLFELYLGNNKISTTRDIYNLKVLTNLIILDLYGNPLLEKLESYRIYVVFHLPSLKALNGVAVEVSECDNAKDTFGGRLTPDMVAEKLGHSNYKEITELNMQSCSVRVVDLAPPDLFQNLHSINLEHNNLTSFSGLIFLPKVKALCLNHNHIESILPRQKMPIQMSNRQILYHKVSSSGYGQQGSNKANRDWDPGDSAEPLMSSLEVLHLSHNGITNLANLQLSRLTNLKALFLQGNDISQVEGLEGLYTLRELVLDQNRIRVLNENSFCSQTSLLELHMSENRLRELTHLQPLPQLRRLFLSMNKLEELTELEKLEVLPSLIELSVVGNPVARRSLHRPGVVLRLSRLQVLDGLMVTLEERTRAELLSTDTQYSAMDMTLPTLLPYISRATTVRGGATGTLLGQEILLDSAHSHTCKKQKQGRGGQPEVVHAVRGAGSLLPSTHKILLTYPDEENRFQSNNGPKPPHM
ncbi:leucine-rich repeat-containing protein 9 [Alosa sapidissima]|uniref:leucine-rich repeat-containing protein 9 n=1 Tax=Alosa sapidissima TaxID=34773 RepID=UPI001C09917C|nr:leucine-rich repeat-containing protein 9 [Alosa sapidissima]